MSNHRLAYFPLPAVDLALGRARTVRLAHKVNYQGDRILEEGGMETKPALLVSFFYLKPYLEQYHRYEYRDWALDSGAFSAYNSGVVIDLQEYIETCQRLKAEDETLTEVFSLDVIGGPGTGTSHKQAARQTLKNTVAMWEAGIPAIPCYHLGEPESVLKLLAKEYPKVALGGVARKKGTIKKGFAQACFARIWPKPVHGFGYGTEELIMAFPWHSTDATNWELGPCAFGRWNSFGKMSVRGSRQNLRAEVEWFLKLEDKARQRWSHEMKVLDSMPPSSSRLAVSGQKTSGGESTRRRKALTEQKLGVPLTQHSMGCGVEALGPKKKRRRVR
jgi:hypothetical protein